MAFEVKESLQQIHKDVATYVDTLSRGDDLPMAVIEELSGIQRYGPHWSHVISCLKRHLLRSRGIVIWPKYNGVYSLLTNKEQAIDYPKWQQRVARRRLRRTKKAINAVDGSQLSTHQRTVLAQQNNYLAHQIKQLYRGIHDGEKRRTKTIPSRPLPMVVG